MNKKNALVTGASRGIGLAIAKRLEADGFRVYAPTRKEMDLLSDRSIDSYISKLKDPVDILINNAGINIVAGALEVSDDIIQKTLEVNLLAPLRLIRHLAPGMRKRQFGRIVNISSIWGIITKPGRLAYSISKAGLIAMTKTLALELSGHNILVNAIAPGYVNTELTYKNNNPQEIEKIKKAIPLGRLAEVDEIAGVVSFLVSQSNTYICGQTIIVDGGFTCR